MPSRSFIKSSTPSANRRSFPRPSQNHIINPQNAKPHPSLPTPSNSTSSTPSFQLCISLIPISLVFQYNLFEDYSQYFFYCLLPSMQQTSSFVDCLTNIQKSLSIEPLSENSIHFPSPIDKMKEELFNCENTYYGQVERNILLAKIRIDDSLERVKTQNDGERNENLQKNVLKILQSRLSGLNGDVDHLLKEGMLTLYMDLCDLREKAQKMNISKRVEHLLKSVIEIASPLLRPFFIYQEYYRSRSTPAKKKNILSMRNLNQGIPQSSALDQNLIREIEEALASQPISQLLDSYMNKQVKVINQTLSVCRICSYKIKLENMEKHVKLCQKKCVLKQQVEDLNAKIANLMEELKDQYKLINERVERTQEEDSFRKVAKLLLCSDKKKERNVMRRSSLVGVRSEKSFKDRFQQFIEDYQYQNGEHFILHRILQACKEKGYLEKRINTLQINALNSDQNQSQSFADKCMENEQTEDNEGMKVNIEQKPFKLLKFSSFEELHFPSQKSNASFNFQQDRSFMSKSSNLSFHHLKERISTKKSLKKESKHVDFQDICKHYVSLQDIPIDQQEKLSVSLENFEILRFLGQGAFGKVYLARRIETGDVYALKMIKINSSNSENEIQAIKNQHQIFKKIAGDHLVKAPFSFSEKESHVFVLEYLPGGDLRKMLDDEVYFEQDKAQFYLAEIVLAIEHLHNFDIIHRDLKPENLVIAKDGHLKLTDFGLSEFQIQVKMEKTRRLSQQAKHIRRRRMRRSAGIWGNNGKGKLIGTPDYIAPEIISQVSVKNFTIDWWSLGVMTYQMLVGVRPFGADTIQEVLDNITGYRIEWPEVGYEAGMITPEAKDLICQLLNTDFVNRLGANGAEEVKAHPFFAGIDWNSLKKSRPPTVPKPNTLTQFSQMREDKQLRGEVERLMGSSSNQKKRLHLERFVRFDILGDETIEDVEKLYEQKSSRLQKLKSICKVELGGLEDCGSEGTTHC